MLFFMRPIISINSCTLCFTRQHTAAWQNSHLRYYMRKGARKSYLIRSVLANTLYSNSSTHFVTKNPFESIFGEQHFPRNWLDSLLRSASLDSWVEHHVVIGCIASSYLQSSSSSCNGKRRNGWNGQFLINQESLARHALHSSLALSLSPTKGTNCRRRKNRRDLLLKLMKTMSVFAAPHRSAAPARLRMFPGECTPLWWMIQFAFTRHHSEQQGVRSPLLSNRFLLLLPRVINENPYVLHKSYFFGIHY